MLRPFYLFCIILFIYSITNAQTQPDSVHASPLTVSGAADVYFRHDLAGQVNDLTSFTHTSNQFRLGMANVKFEYKTTHTDLVAELGVGPRMQEFAYTDSGVLQAIKQLYISYSPTHSLKFTAGTWATHL